MSTKSSDVRKELHGFCDASKIAYAAVVYLIIIDSDGNNHVSLVAAISKVAPIKQVSIPRLELCGSVELVRLLEDIAKVLNVDNTNFHQWTDATIVLSWLNSLPSRWKVFVANRVSEIHTHMNPQQWSHVKTTENPADCASRGISPVEIKNRLMWLKGPDFLLVKDVNYYKPCELITQVEAVKVHTLTIEKMIWEDYSTLIKLVKIVAYCTRFFKNEEENTDGFNGFLETVELRQALESCIRKDQRFYFQDEI